jgi:hypothetical protein
MTMRKDNSTRARRLGSTSEAPCLVESESGLAEEAEFGEGLKKKEKE